jgi:hypothetical protein
MSRNGKNTFHKIIKLKIIKKTIDYKKNLKKQRKILEKKLGCNFFFLNFLSNL